MADIKAIAEALVNISSTEVKELADVLKNEYNIEAQTEKKKYSFKHMPFNQRGLVQKKRKK